MALDIDDWGETVKFGIDLDSLYAAPDAVTILSGKPGHGKLLYKMPFGSLPSWTYAIDRRAIFNFRCSTEDKLTVHDVLPPSIHPDTKMPYQWGGAGHWSKLPWIPSNLLSIWTSNLKDNTHIASTDTFDSSWDEVKSALAFIDPDCNRDEWIRIGMALQWAGEQTSNPDQAFVLWNDWSSQGTKYVPREMQLQWRSMRVNKGAIVTLGTLFKIAKQNGWIKPFMDTSSLFTSTMVKPENIISSLKAAPPNLTLDLWPKTLAQRAKEVSTTVGSDPLVSLWAGLGAVCGVIDARIRLELMSGFKVPPVLWLMTIGDPGDRKTPGSEPMFTPLRNLELSDHKRYAIDRQHWEYKDASWAKARDAVLKYAGSPEGLLDPTGTDAPPYAGDKPEPPVPLKITVDDITSQALVGMVAPRPRGVLCVQDEMNSWCYKVCNGATGENRSTWVRSYEAKRYEVDRKGDGPTHCDNFAVSIYGNMQPQLLEEYFPRLTCDGLLQRFLPCVLRHDQTRIGQPIPEYLTSAAAWENLLHQTYALTPRTYRLSPDGLKVYRAYQEWYEDRMKSERLLHTSNEFITAFGKITGLAGRLILIFHAIESPFIDEVSADVVTRVVRIVREFIIPTYRYVFDSEGNMSTFDEWVMSHILQNADRDRIRMSEIKGSARRQWEILKVNTHFMQYEWIITAMDTLERMEWVKRIDDKTQESKGVAEWIINPHLKTTFEDYRKNIVAAKREQELARWSIAGIDPEGRQSKVNGIEILDS